MTELANEVSAELVDAYLGHLAESPTFFPEVDDNTTTAVLGLLDSFLNAKHDYNHDMLALTARRL